MNLKRLAIAVAVVCAIALAYLIPQWLTSDIERIRRTLKAMEQAAEARNPRKLIGFVADHFKSRYAANRGELQGYVFYFTQRFRNVDVQVGDVDIRILASKRHAEVTAWLVIWAADVKSGKERVISRWKKTDQVVLQFEKDGFSWLVTGFEVRKRQDPEPDQDPNE